MKYIKKQQPIEAIQWTGDVNELIKFGIMNSDFDELNRVFLDHPRGYFPVSIGDYIIRHEGRHYQPCSQELFESMYEKVE